MVSKIWVQKGQKKVCLICAIGIQDFYFVLFWTNQNQYFFDQVEINQVNLFTSLIYFDILTSQMMRGTHWAIVAYIPKQWSSHIRSIASWLCSLSKGNWWTSSNIFTSYSLAYNKHHLQKILVIWKPHKDLFMLH